MTEREGAINLSGFRGWRRDADPRTGGRGK
jgi:hypothetical protein